MARPKKTKTKTTQSTNPHSTDMTRQPCITHAAPCDPPSHWDPCHREAQIAPRGGGASQGHTHSRSTGARIRSQFPTWSERLITAPVTGSIDDPSHPGASPPQAVGWPSLSPACASPAPNYRPRPGAPGSTGTVGWPSGGAWLSRFRVLTQTASPPWLPESRTRRGRAGKQVQAGNPPATLLTAWTAGPPRKSLLR